jgi:hypothetical protein
VFHELSKIKVESKLREEKKNLAPPSLTKEKEVS